MTERFIRDALLKRKWSDEDLDELTIEYISRGSPGDRARFHGHEILHIGRSFVELSEGTMIPFHRMTGIFKGDELIWSRETTQLLRESKSPSLSKTLRGNLSLKIGDIR